LAREPVSSGELGRVVCSRRCLAFGAQCAAEGELGASIALASIVRPPLHWKPPRGAPNGSSSSATGHDLGRPPRVSPSTREAASHVYAQLGPAVIAHSGALAPAGRPAAAFRCGRSAAGRPEGHTGGRPSSWPRADQLSRPASAGQGGLASGAAQVGRSSKVSVTRANVPQMQARGPQGRQRGPFLPWASQRLALPPGELARPRD